MTAVKTFVFGVLAGTIFGATFLGVVSHLLIIAPALFGAGTLALPGKAPPHIGGRGRKDVNASPTPGA